jgi:hypothetical protein
VQREGVKRDAEHALQCCPACSGIFQQRCEESLGKRRQFKACLSGKHARGWNIDCTVGTRNYEATIMMLNINC